MRRRRVHNIVALLVLLLLLLPLATVQAGEGDAELRELKPGELAVLTFKVAVTDDSGQVLTEDGEIVTAIREFREVSN